MCEVCEATYITTYIKVDSDVDVDNVAAAQWSRVRDAMADALINTRTHAFGVGPWIWYKCVIVICNNTIP